MATATKSTGSGLTRKLGPLPVWAWAGVGVVAILVVYKLYKSRQQTAAQAAAPGSTDTLGTSAQDSGLAGASLGGTPASTSAAPDLSSLLDTTTSLIQSQQSLVAELANGAQTVAMNADQQLGSLAAGDQGLLAQILAQQGGGATPASGGGGGAGSGTGTGSGSGGAASAGNTRTVPAMTPVPHVEPNMGGVSTAHPGSRTGTVTRPGVLM